MGMSAGASEQAQRKKTRAWDRYKYFRAVLAEGNHGHSLVPWPLDVHQLLATADRRHSTADDRQRGNVAFLPAVCSSCLLIASMASKNGRPASEFAFAKRWTQHPRRRGTGAPQRSYPCRQELPRWYGQDGPFTSALPRKNASSTGVTAP